MSKVTVQLVVYNSKKYLKQVFDSVFNQTFKDFDVQAIICGSVDGSKEYIEQNYASVKILDPGTNLGFAGGHNYGFSKSDSDLVLLIGNDLILEPTYIEELIKVFDDPQVGAATGKLYQIDLAKNERKNILDTTGVVVFANGRARDRGQHEEDMGQYDRVLNVAAVSGAAPMYRRSAIQEVGYFDEDFFMYWEDVDLSLRLLHAGYKNMFVPKAIGYHGRGSGSSKDGVAKVGSFVKHRTTINQNARKYNFKNHIFVVIKNFPRIGLSFWLREILMLGYVVLLETKTLSIVPVFIKQLPTMLKKRKQIVGSSKLTAEEFEKYFEHGQSLA